MLFWFYFFSIIYSERKFPGIHSFLVTYDTAKDTLPGVTNAECLAYGMMKFFTI